MPACKDPNAALANIDIACTRTAISNPVFIGRFHFIIVTTEAGLHSKDTAASTLVFVDNVHKRQWTCGTVE